MTDWIDFSVYAAMTAIFWFVSAHWAALMALQMAGDRNQDWLAANREHARTLLSSRWLVGSRWFRWSCYAWGAVSLSILLAIQIDVWPQFLASSTHAGQQWAVLKDAHATLLIVGLLDYFAVIVVSMRRLAKDVPLPERRQATLTPRTVSGFVPRWFRMATYALIGVHLAAWIVVGTLGLYSAADFWVRSAGPVTFTAIFLVIAQAMVHLRASDALGVPDRRLGVYFAFGSLIYVQLMFALRLYGEVVGPSFDVDRALHLTLTASLVLGMLLLAFVQRSNPRGLKPALYDPA
jgi:hypothetical protein